MDLIYSLNNFLNFCQISIRSWLLVELHHKQYYEYRFRFRINDGGSIYSEIKNFEINLL